MKVKISYEPLMGPERNAELSFAGEEPLVESPLTITGDMDYEYVNGILASNNESSVMGYVSSIENSTPEAILRTLELMGCRVDWPEAWLDPDFDPWQPDEIN